MLDVMNRDYTTNTTGVCPYCGFNNANVLRADACEHVERGAIVKGIRTFGYSRELTGEEKAEMVKWERLLGIQLERETV